MWRLPCPRRSPRPASKTRAPHVATASHRANLSIPKFFIDKHPATNANYSAYLAATGYKPRGPRRASNPGRADPLRLPLRLGRACGPLGTGDPANWLKHWKGAVRPPAALADLPVTYLSLVDARAYCAWRAGGARLPHTYEWQYAAQGTDGRPYPWGATKDAAHFPHGTTGNTYGGPEPVGTYSPAGDSPFGVSDLVGNVCRGQGLQLMATSRLALACYSLIRTSHRDRSGSTPTSSRTSTRGRCCCEVRRSRTRTPV